MLNLGENTQTVCLKDRVIVRMVMATNMVLSIRNNHNTSIASNAFKCYFEISTESSTPSKIP